MFNINFSFPFNLQLDVSRAMLVYKLIFLYFESTKDGYLHLMDIRFESHI
jgi:hypothetical protein